MPENQTTLTRNSNGGTGEDFTVVESGSSKKTDRRKTDRSDKERKVSEDILLTAEDLLYEIDDAIKPQISKVEFRPSTVHLGIDNEMRRHDRVKITNEPGTSKYLGNKTRKDTCVKAFDKYGHINIDAVAKWVTSSNVDIDLTTDTQKKTIIQLRNNRKRMIAFLKSLT
ncbi:uncharacterized protein LOC132741447 [Ruditapes philippinarum]|uniref:uncharacterized protein LOC132741447 n=1 Tax=Ruditapes philippinarum TaxID=129788 RepID=UPI00295A995A|nr:uncharacterized protein LOC132741447 [Ruditapes philippinarum]